MKIKATIDRSKRNLNKKTQSVKLIDEEIVKLKENKNTNTTKQNSEEKYRETTQNSSQKPLSEQSTTFDLDLNQKIVENKTNGCIFNDSYRESINKNYNKQSFIFVEKNEKIQNNFISDDKQKENLKFNYEEEPIENIDDDINNQLDEKLNNPFGYENINKIIKETRNIKNNNQFTNYMNNPTNTIDENQKNNLFNTNLNDSKSQIINHNPTIVENNIITHLPQDNNSKYDIIMKEIDEKEENIMSNENKKYEFKMGYQNREKKKHGIPFIDEMAKKCNIDYIIHDQFITNSKPFNPFISEKIIKPKGLFEEEKKILNIESNNLVNNNINQSRNIFKIELINNNNNVTNNTYNKNNEKKLSNDKNENINETTNKKYSKLAITEKDNKNEANLDVEIDNKNNKNSFKILNGEIIKRKKNEINKIHKVNNNKMDFNSIKMEKINSKLKTEYKNNISKKSYDAFIEDKNNKNKTETNEQINKPDNINTKNVFNIEYKNINVNNQNIINPFNYNSCCKKYNKQDIKIEQDQILNVSTNENKINIFSKEYCMDKKENDTNKNQKNQSENIFNTINNSDISNLENTYNTIKSKNNNKENYNSGRNKISNNNFFDKSFGCSLSSIKNNTNSNNNESIFDSGIDTINKNLINIKRRNNIDNNNNNKNNFINFNNINNNIINNINIKNNNVKNNINEDLENIYNKDENKRNDDIYMNDITDSYLDWDPFNNNNLSESSEINSNNNIPKSSGKIKNKNFNEFNSEEEDSYNENYFEDQVYNEV